MKPITIENAKTIFFASKEAYLNFKKTWAEKAQKKEISSSDIILYNLLRGKPSTNGFTPITNKIKLANGCSEDGAYPVALWSIKSTLIWHLKKQTPANEEVSVLFVTMSLETLSLLSEYLRQTP